MTEQDFSLYDRLRLYPEIVLDETVNNVRSYLQFLLDRINNPQEEDNKGLILESLARILLESPYLQFNQARRNCEAGEIDLDFTVRKFPTTLFAEFDILLIVECKNWGKRAGAPELRVFRDKICEVKSNIGIFFSKKGITRDAKVVIRDACLVDGIVILVFDAKDLDLIINQSENLYTILHKKYLAVRTSSQE